MTIKTKKIQQRFDAASHSYDSVAHIQKQCAERLTHQLRKKWPEFSPSSVLDLGTGTGYLPELLLPLFPTCPFTLNDLSPRMLARAQEKVSRYPYVQGQLGDMETAVFDFHDLIVSNLALQWMNDAESALRAFYLNSNVMAFTCLVDGTFHEWNHVVQHHDAPSPVQPYPSSSQLKRFLCSLNPSDHSFTTRDFRMRFEGAQSFMVYLKQLGASFSETHVSFTQLRQLIQGQPEAFDVTYRVFFGLLRR